jgi:hypothetical protein
VVVAPAFMQALHLVAWRHGIRGLGFGHGGSVGIC